MKLILKMHKQIHILPQSKRYRTRTRINGYRKKIIIKKDKKIEVREPKEIIKLANQLKKELQPYSQKIEIAGSIRRKKDPNDIDLVLIPKESKKEEIKKLMRKKGDIIQEGESKAGYNIKKVKTELYFTKPRSWGATLYYGTGPGNANIGRRTWARERGMLLNQWGVFDRKTGRYLAGRTEQDIYKTLGRSYKKPEERG